MKLVNINKNGTQKFQLKDGRIIYSYNSGYVRIDGGLDRLYQINKVRKVKSIRRYYNYYRILIPCPSERFQFITFCFFVCVLCNIIIRHFCILMIYINIIC